VDRNVRNGLARSVAALTRNDMDRREFMNGALSWGERRYCARHSSTCCAGLRVPH